MTLSSEIEFDDIEDDSEVIGTSQTYKIDFENGRIPNEFITGLDAIKQFVYLSLHTERYAYSVHSHD